jgi:hypothetical protein
VMRAPEVVSSNMGLRRMVFPSRACSVPAGAWTILWSLRRVDHAPIHIAWLAVRWIPFIEVNTSRS